MANELGHDQAQHGQEQNDKFIVKYRQKFYDISAFMRKHPGGVNTLKGLNNTDMTSRFLKAPPHSDAAMYLMKEYQIKPADYEKTKQNGVRRGSHSRGGGGGGEKRLENGIELIDEEDNNILDDSMEHLVDWSKAMLPQIPKITAHYNEWVHKPVDRPLRLFGPWWLEMCTKTPWWVIPTFWIPVILKCILPELAESWRSSTDASQLTLLILYFAAGIFFWTLLEYSLHRWVFHAKVDGDAGPVLCTLHFMIHGLHHKVPFDAMRLVFPPVPGVIIASVIYLPLSYVMPQPRVLLGGALLGYLCYDLMHYYLHYGNPTVRAMYHMKRYHYQHHFAHQDIGYGISSPLWDVVFNTRIQLRKLRYTLRWK